MRTLGLMLLVAGIPLAGGRPLTLTQHGRTAFTIVEGERPTMATQHAASELATFLGATSSVEFRVVAASESCVKDLRVGASALKGEAYRWYELGAVTLSKGCFVFLAPGGGPAGYAILLDRFEAVPARGR